ncbi:ABC transporter permease [Pseudomonas fulva]|uniref:Transport permease protein n=1 Tax=Pseudomonas parafulva TaxID=157782 RepID=A0AAJ0LK93_9PSED|nr:MULTISPECIES: ABC transporter permease [Pseudomonas]AQW67786.1 ABC transporter [Pseudomonas parafulva]KTT17858.1 ABC transporter [Pseudomonas parafulva]MBA5708229.1 ABC transporter permease [Pseudomonas fulva]MBF8637521.1 ABC transporter permease [Pseudomonas fulva]MBF8658628.1 ABC transporter permease [Pseudomonas putida]
MLGMLRGLWSYRNFVVTSIRNEFIARFSRSKLGGLWMIIHPLAQVAIYALILSNVLGAKLPGIDNKYAYALYLMAGMLAWNLFAEVVSRCLTLFIEQGNLMKKMSFPRITLPVIVVGTALLNNLLLFVAVVAVFTAFGQPPTLQALWLLPLTFAVVALAVGIGLILGVLNVFLRDIGQVVPIILQVWFWFTPIVYSVNIIPEYMKGVLQMNPMYPIVTGYHNVLVYNRTPNLDETGMITAVAVGLMVIGLFMFRRASAEMVDSL